MPRSITSYTQEFRDRCFTAWYSAGRPSVLADHHDIFPVDENGRKPVISVLKVWRRKYGWDIHADALDTKAIQIRDDYLVVRKADILKKQANDAILIADKALNYLVSGTFDSSASAVSAYFKSTEEVRMAIGISELIEKMSKMSEDELKDEIAKRLKQASEAGQVIEAEEIKGDEYED